MSCATYLYESPEFNAVTSTTVKLYALRSDNRTVLAVAANQNLGRHRWGAKLNFAESPIVYSVYSYDHAYQYAPKFYEDLNGNEPGKLDVVMYMLPTAGTGGGPAPTNFQEIETYVRNQQGWTQNQKQAVRLTILASATGNIRAIEQFALGQCIVGFRSFEEKIAREIHGYERVLYGLGIAPEVMRGFENIAQPIIEQEKHQQQHHMGL